MAARFLSSARLVPTGLLACGVLIGASSARADDAPLTDNPAKAQALFADARKLAQDGDYPQACGKFAESLRLNVGIGTQFNLADCWEHIGRIASARALFLGAAARARAAGQTEREQVAKERAEALEPRLIRLVIDVRATDSELSIRRNHVTVEREAWGMATPIDPGGYLIEASAPGKKTWSANVSVPANASDVISITVPPLEDAAAECPSKADAPSDAATVPVGVVQSADSPVPPVDEAVPRSARRTAYSLSLAGLGVVAIGLGTVLAIEYESKNDDAKAICPSSVGCSDSDISSHAGLVSDAKAFRTGAFVGFGFGAAALVGAAALYFSPDLATQRASGFSAAPFASADGSWGAVASGKF